MAELKLGYKASAEQFAPRELVELAVLAEAHGMDSATVSDHFQPWRHEGGHAPFSLAWMTAVGERTKRLILGTSMGCMQTFVWGETYPDFARALMPLACEPVEIAGVNRMWRQLAINGVEADPAWKGGNYKTQPILGLRTAQSLLFVAGSAPLYYQAEYPTNRSASAFAEERVRTAMLELDANDLIYQLDSSRSYDPWPKLESITAPMTWINSADDFINPRNLDYPHLAVKRMPAARFRLIPESGGTRGHGTHTWAKFWKADLSALLARSEPGPRRKPKRGSS